MKEIGLPPALARPIAKKYEWLKTRYHAIDKTFIARGFATIEARIERDEAMYGKGCYQVFAYQQTHRERIDEWRALWDQVHNELMEMYESKGQAPPVSRAELILSNPELCCTAKQQLLQRHFPQYFSELRAQYRSLMQKAEQKERKNLCRLWGDREPVRLMMDETLIPLRKEVFNTVMADAFGPLGFEKRNRKEGVDIYFKPLTAHYAVVVAPEIHTLKRITHDWGPEFDQELGAPGLNWLTHIGSAKKSDKTAWFCFRPIFATYASNFCHSFRDTQSLELCVRAQALLYELTVAPFEDVIRDT